MTARPTSGAWLGLDIGGTKILAALVSQDCSQILATRRAATAAGNGPESVLATAVKLGHELIADSPHPILGVGVGFAGLVSHQSGVVDSSVILPGWDGIDLRARIETAFELPCAVDNDATVAGLGEYRAMGSPEDAHLVLLTVGTGIGGAILLHGEVFRGRSNTSAEFGNTCIDWQGVECVSGNRGSLNTLASGRALSRQAAKLAQAAPAHSTILPTDGSQASGEVISAAARGGDPVAIAAIEGVARALGAGIANILNIFNPDSVVLAGGLCNLGPGYLAMVRDEAQARAFPTNVRDAEIGFSTHGDFTVVHGAACLAANETRPYQAPGSVPSKDYRRQYKALWPALKPVLQGVFEAENPILGESVQRFEAEFAKYIGSAHAVGVGSGTDALVLALRSLGIGEGDEVITAANTFMATVTAILSVGARPVLVDPDPITLNLSAAGLEEAVTSRTKAVIPVHLYGRLCDMESLQQVCGAAGVDLIEDAAQAHGARCSTSLGRAGSFGRLGCFSFHPSKNLGAFGDAGMVCTDDPRLLEVLRELRNLGKSGKYEFSHVAPNAKLDTLQAAILRIKLADLDAHNERRLDFARIYHRELGGLDLDLPTLPNHGEHVFHLFPVHCDDRDGLRGFLRERGVNAGLHYPIPPHLQQIPVDLGYRAGDFPITERSARRELSLPIAPELRGEEVLRVCALIREFFCEVETRRADHATT